jgi:UDP-N-acetylmuramoyl-L-alanyl-D-glutamate--2,6-diaminopimelate ligase
LAILRDIEAGLVRRPSCRVRTEPDRRQAISLAAQEGGSHDVIVLAGKGHETYQEIAGVKYPFDDRAEARAALEAP